MNTTVYVRRRRAYTPHCWPLMLVAIALAVVFAALVQSPLLALIGGVLISVIVVHARLAIWKAQHPVISLDQYGRDMQRKRQGVA